MRSGKRANSSDAHTTDVHPTLLDAPCSLCAALALLETRMQTYSYRMVAIMARSMPTRHTPGFEVEELQLAPRSQRQLTDSSPSFDSGLPNAFGHAPVRSDPVPMRPRKIMANPLAMPTMIRPASISMRKVMVRVGVGIDAGLRMAWLPA